MKTVQVDERRVRLLIARFVEVCLEQYEIIYSLGNTSRYNRLFVEMQRIKAELQQMRGDQRRALLPLLSHFNAQVQLQAAHSLLVLFPEAARKCLESIRDSDVMPQNADAAGALRGLDEGTYIPR